MKPYVFIGSSAEGKPVANAIQEHLEEGVEAAVWSQDLFRPSEYALESLVRELDRADAGILIFTPDDVVRGRGLERNAAKLGTAPRRCGSSVSRGGVGFGRLLV